MVEAHSGDGGILLQSDAWLKAGIEPPGTGFHAVSWEQCRDMGRLFPVASVPDPWRNDEDRTAEDRMESSSIFPETKLVKDSLHALQGVPAAIKELSMLSAFFSLQSADKTSHNISTLWTSSVTTSALAKLLSQLALGGSRRYELEKFVEFFLGGDHVNENHNAKEERSSKSRRKRLARKSAQNEPERSNKSSNLKERNRALHGLLNQAFAAAVQTILQGHSASLNTLLEAVYFRRLGNSCAKSVLGDCGGPLFGFGYGTISLLELYLHTEDLRTQLQALTKVCLISTRENSSSRTSAADKDIIPAMDIEGFEAFPKGADLLTYLYNLLLEPDPVHLELLRFLFARTCEPYVLFVRSCIYCAAFKDPYEEFIVEQTFTGDSPEKATGLESQSPTEHCLNSTFKVRTGVSTPIFLVQVCRQLLRAGQQLEVLLKLPETRDFAQNLATLAFGSTLEGKARCENNEAYPSPSMAFDKKGLQGILRQRESKVEAMKAHYLRFFGNTSATSPVQHSGKGKSQLEDSCIDDGIGRITTLNLEEPNVATCEVNRDLLEFSDNTNVAASEEMSHTSETSTSSPDANDEVTSLGNGVISCVTAESSPGQGMYHGSFLSHRNYSKGTCVELEEACEINTFLSGYHRGTSWLDVGLPRNPFFSCNDDISPYGYISTLFTDTESGWNISSNFVNEESLLKKLVPELAQVKGILSLARSTGFKEGAGVSILLREENLPSILRVEPTRSSFTAEKADHGNQLEHQLEATSVDEEKPVNQVRAQGGGTWETSLKLVQESNLPDNDEQEAADYDNEEIPISVVVERCIVQEILTQYRFVSIFTVRLLQENLRLHDHYLALRRYYFMEVGDWADYFITTLCYHNWGPSSYQHRQVEVQGMLEAALQKSSCDWDRYAERLHICRSSGDQATAFPGFVDYHRLEAFDFIELGYHVDWPLSLVLTSDALSLYKLIFKLLLRLKLVVFALGEISQCLQIMERSLYKDKVSNFEQQNRFRVLQLFRHQIGHFVTAVQFHVQSQLLHVVWSKFLQAIQHEVKDMQDLGFVHYSYLTNAAHQCFLSSELSGVKICVDNIMQCLLDFRSCLLRAKNIGPRLQPNVCDDHFYSKVLELKSSFFDNIRCLHKFYLKSEPQYLLSEFWMTLDYNGFFSSTC